METLTKQTNNKQTQSNITRPRTIYGAALLRLFVGLPLHVRPRLFTTFFKASVVSGRIYLAYKRERSCLLQQGAWETHTCSFEAGWWMEILLNKNRLPKRAVQGDLGLIRFNYVYIIKF